MKDMLITAYFCINLSFISKTATRVSHSTLFLINICPLLQQLQKTLTHTNGMLQNESECPQPSRFILCTHCTLFLSQVILTPFSVFCFHPLLSWLFSLTEILLLHPPHDPAWDLMQSDSVLGRQKEKAPFSLTLLHYHAVNSKEVGCGPQFKNPFCKMQRGRHLVCSYGYNIGFPTLFMFQPVLEFFGSLAWFPELEDQ